MARWRHLIFLGLFFILFIGPFSAVAPAASDSNNAKIVSLDVKYRPMYATCCDLTGNGLKDIVVANDHELTIFRQNRDLVFKSLAIKLKDKIIAINPIRLNKTTKESLLCIGENKLFYFSLGNDGAIEGPQYLNIPENHPVFTQKQKNMKNCSFVMDMNKDGLDDIVIPSEKGISIVWQENPAIFKLTFVQFAETSTGPDSRISPWPRVGDNTDNIVKGVSFFPTINKQYNFWIQDLNEDGLLDIIYFSYGAKDCSVTICLQTPGGEFNTRNIPAIKNDFDEIRFIDINKDGLLDMVESKTEYPLQGNDSLLPIISAKIYLAHALLQFDSSPTYAFKTVFLPGLDNITDIDGDGQYEIVTSTAPLKLGTKESLIKIATNKEISFNLIYSTMGKGGYEKSVEFNKSFSFILPSPGEIDSARRFVKFDNMKSDGIMDIILLKKNSLIELDFLRKKGDSIMVDSSVDVKLPCRISEIKIIDVNADGKKEFLVLDSIGNNLYIVSLNFL